MNGLLAMMATDRGSAAARIVAHHPGSIEDGGYELRRIRPHKGSKRRSGDDDLHCGYRAIRKAESLCKQPSDDALQHGYTMCS